MKKEIEFYQERRKHRIEARKYLPLKLQAEFLQKKPETEKWSFEGKLMRLRESQEPEDKLFLEYLRLKIKERIGKKIKPKDLLKLKELQESAEVKRKKIISGLKILFLYEKGMNDSSLEVRYNTAQSLGGLAKTNDPSIVKEANNLLNKSRISQYDIYNIFLITELLKDKIDLRQLKLNYQPEIELLMNYSQKIN